MKISEGVDVLVEDSVLPLSASEGTKSALLSMGATRSLLSTAAVASTSAAPSNKMRGSSLSMRNLERPVEVLFVLIGSF